MDQDAVLDQAQTSGVSAPGNTTKLFLGGLSWETNEEKLRLHFEEYGEISEVIVMRDRNTSKPRGFGFVTFKEAAAASAACRDSHTLDGRTIDAKPSVPQGEQQRPRSKKIFVGGLAPDTTEDQFRSYFEMYGTVLEAQIMVDHTSGRSRGFGFITFDDEVAANRVFAAGPMHELSGKRVEVKSATPKGSGPQGRSGAATPIGGLAGDRPGAAPGAAALVPGAAGRAAMVPGRAYSGFSGLSPAMAMGAGGYQIPPGYMVAGYGPYGLMPAYGTFPPGAMQMGGPYPYPGFGGLPGYGMPFMQPQFQQQAGMQAGELQLHGSGSLSDVATGGGAGGATVAAAGGVAAGSQAAQTAAAQQRGGRLGGHAQASAPDSKPGRSRAGAQS